MPRTSQRTEPIFKARGANKPQQPHLAGASVGDFVLEAPPNKHHGLFAHVVSYTFDFRCSDTTKAKQNFVAALVSMSPDMCARLKHLNSRREVVVR